MTESTLALHGITVLVTRPAEQAGAVLAELQAAGARVLLQPLLEIKALGGSTNGALDAQLAVTDLLVFISANAVQHFPALAQRALRWPARCRIGAIGEKTAQALSSIGLKVDLVPSSGFTSEDFLQLPGLQQIRDQRVLIVRGAGGRERLAQDLMQRGALVSYFEVYRRLCPAELEPGVLAQLRQSRRAVLLLTSVESLQNLLALVSASDWQWLRLLTLIAGGPRIAAAAQQAGFVSGVVVADDPSDNSMLKALQEWA